MQFNFLSKKQVEKTEEKAADVSAALPSLTKVVVVPQIGKYENQADFEVQEENALKAAAHEIMTSEQTYKDKIHAIVDVGATAKALKDEELRKVLTDNKAEELKNISEASRIESKTEAIKRKSEREKTLFERYGYVYELFGIKKEIPNFYCVIILAIYAVFGTLYAVLFGIPFMVVNLFVDSLSALFSKINGLTKNVWGGLKYMFMCAMVLLVFAIIGGGLYYLFHIMGAW